MGAAGDLRSCLFALLVGGEGRGLVTNRPWGPVLLLCVILGWSVGFSALAAAHKVGSKDLTGLLGAHGVIMYLSSSCFTLRVTVLLFLSSALT